MDIQITTNMCTITGVIFLFLGIVGVVIVRNNYKKSTSLPFMVTAVISIMLFVVSGQMIFKGLVEQGYTLKDDQTVIQVVPTTASLPLEKGDTVKIYGYGEDNTVFKDNIDKEYTVYSVDDGHSISPVDICCSDADVEELREILSKSKDVEIKKVSKEERLK